MTTRKMADQLYGAMRKTAQGEASKSAAEYERMCRKAGLPKGTPMAKTSTTTYTGRQAAKFRGARGR